MLRGENIIKTFVENDTNTMIIHQSGQVDDIMVLSQIK